mmetsp:Transcript_5681/g.10160  ORF Transcript_5681/g.10160 Transcript_5681/m.10160 type:complete len:440 (-) Transcript_5681:51-1370(-)
MKQLLLAILPLASAWKLRSPEDGNLSLAAESQAPGRALCADFTCAAGYIKAGKEFGSSQAVCCMQTCMATSCPTGYRKNKAYDANIFAEVSDCCDIECEKAEAEGHFKCEEGHGLHSPTALASTAEQCCAQKCSAHACGPLWVKDTSEQGQNKVGNTDEACCLQACAQVKCDHGYEVDDTKADRPGTTKEQCCVRTCQLISCEGSNPNGGTDYGIPLPKLKMKANSSADCCEKQCRHHECSKGWLKDVTNDHLYNPSDATCCLMTCTHFECSKPFVQNPAKTGSLGNTQDACCLPSCSLYDCHALPGWANSTEKADVPQSDDPKTCCQKTCWQYSCPAQFRHRKFLDNELGNSDEDCCEPVGCRELRERKELKGKRCHTLGESDCASHFERFPMQDKKKRSRLVPCMFDKQFKFCHLNDKAEVPNCVDAPELSVAPTEK